MLRKIPDSDELDRLIRGVGDGQRSAVARCLRLVDDVPALGREIARRLHKDLKGARIIGITGNPGAGKSTVVDRMIEGLRARGKRVGILAIDPSSPFSGGAILGDRIRMSRHFDDEGVFIRSLATRGALGGLSRSTFDSVRVLDAAGFDTILVETVGVGQDEVDVVRLADTTVVIVVPGLGDDIQAIKAGLLEIADVFLINKADRPGADEVERGLTQLLTYNAPSIEGKVWEPLVLRSIASRGEGLVELLEGIEQHREYLSTPGGSRRTLLRQRELFLRILDAALVERGRLRHAEAMKAAVVRLDAGEDAYGLVAELIGEHS